MIKEHWQDYKEYLKGLSADTLKRRREEMKFKLENEPYKLVDRGKTEMELEIITDVILEMLFVSK